jgi:hypothetical protein
MPAAVRSPIANRTSCIRVRTRPIAGSPSLCTRPSTNIPPDLLSEVGCLQLAVYLFSLCSGAGHRSITRVPCRYATTRRRGWQEARLCRAIILRPPRSNAWAGQRRFCCPSKTGTLAINFKSRSLTNRANPKAEKIAAPGVERRRWVVAESN